MTERGAVLSVAQKEASGIGGPTPLRLVHQSSLSELKLGLINYLSDDPNLILS